MRNTIELHYCAGCKMTTRHAANSLEYTTCSRCGVNKDFVRKTPIQSVLQPKLDGYKPAIYIPFQG